LALDLPPAAFLSWLTLSRHFHNAATYSEGLPNGKSVLPALARGICEISTKSKRSLRCFKVTPAVVNEHGSALEWFSFELAGAFL
jgi:hypothetical protein